MTTTNVNLMYDEDGNPFIPWINIASSTNLGLVKADGITTNIDSSGVISASSTSVIFRRWTDSNE